MTVQSQFHQPDYFAGPLHHSVRTRVSWLMLLFLAESMTGTVLRQIRRTAPTSSAAMPPVASAADSGVELRESVPGGSAAAFGSGLTMLLL